MLRPRFYSIQPLPDTGGLLNLDAEPARHIARTLRMREGDILCLFDGSGRESRATITTLTKNAVTVDAEAARLIGRESPLASVLAVAVSRGDRMDLVVQKATELGAAGIWPLLSERVGVRLESARWEKKLQHWTRIAISACEQCGRNRIPDIPAPQSLDAVLQRAADCELRLLLHPATGAANLPESCGSLCLLVGPEGGFSDSEVARCSAAGFRPTQLGPRVLRTETAPLAALAIAQARWGDLL